ncbi:hypothetical protein, variant [Aphanomyces astaci]|uniref:Exportin-4 n=1 Tax=Aphanomyces astaci TaxID=112090 RepID=W4FN78_APHAT|nr:hypothetical protein, variant [Aphanomyces astaci]ETV68386.1 hypothetical protein, variant [Aphanomyces astaci]|eukprot:XP_009842180.1 hypothetical protein, variant [Aphanomyces astaci]
MEAVEEACLAFAAGRTTAERQAAESVLHHFKQSPQAHADSIHLLTHSAVPMAQFHAVTTLCELSLLERVSVSQRKETIGFLLHHATSSSSMPSFVASALISTIAILIKRNWLQESPTDRTAILSHITQLASSSSNTPSNLVGIKLLLAFVTEMRGASDKKTRAMFQPVAFHTSCRQALEKDGLVQILALAVHLITHQPSPQALEHVYLLTVELLQWFEAPSDSTSILLAVDPRWKPYLVQASFVQAIFQAYTTHRSHGLWSHTIRQVLILLASVTGSIFDSPDHHVAYITWIFHGALFIFHHPLPSNVEREVIDMCQLTYRLVSNWSSLNDPALADPLVSEVARLSCLLLQSALQEADEDGGEVWQMEGLDVLMDAWSLLTAPFATAALPPPPTIQAASAQVVRLYLQVRLRLVCRSDDNDAEEDEDIELNVAKTLEEQLGLVASLARLNAPQNLSLCLSLLVETANERRTHTTKSLDDESFRHVLDKLHFVILFTGIVIADEYKGEKPAVPWSMEATLSVVEQLVHGVLTLLAEEIQAVQVAPQRESPYLSEQLLSTATRLHVTYFDIFPSKSADMVALYCQSATVYLTHWYMQPHVIQNVVELLLALPKTPAAVGLCMQSAQFQWLTHSILAVQGALLYIPSQRRGLMCEALVRIIVPDAPDQLAPFVSEWHRCLDMMTQSSTTTHSHIQVESILELYAGLARSSESRSFAAVEPLVLPWFPLLLRTLETFQSVPSIVPLVLKCACDFVEANLAYLSLDKAMDLYGHCDRLIGTFCVTNSVTQRSAISDDELQFEDMFMLLTLLSHLVAKDVIDFADDTANSV